MDRYLYPYQREIFQEAGCKPEGLAIFIHWIKIDGQEGYQAKSKSSEQAEDTSPEAPASTAYPDSTSNMC
ncbi:hypothetical protein KVR801_220003 [Klebsiella variicola]|nr:hypothetical protein KVR801_220003 [Klebsiella variicola]